MSDASFFPCSIYGYKSYLIANGAEYNANVRTNGEYMGVLSYSKFKNVERRSELEILTDKIKSHTDMAYCARMEADRLYNLHGLNNDCLNNVVIRLNFLDSELRILLDELSSNEEWMKQ